jgi:Cas7 group CRISPR-associated protein Csh2
MSSNGIPRATGLLVIEVKNSNPNGDPDRESDPRRRSHDERGVITGVSFKRKIRDLVLAKDGEVWKHCCNGFVVDEFDILERRDIKRTEVNKMLKASGGFDAFKNRFWDARVFGNTFLEEGGGDTIRAGVAHFGLGISVSPVRVERMTKTKMAPAQSGSDGEEGPSRGMAPLAHRIVVHGLYCMPFFVNPTAALKSGCQARDIGLLLKLIRHAYPHTKSDIRPFVDVRHAWYAEHKDPLCSFSEFRFIEAITPKRKGNTEEPSSDVVPLKDQYDVPRALPDELKATAVNFCDLVEKMPDWVE